MVAGSLPQKSMTIPIQILQLFCLPEAGAGRLVTYMYFKWGIHTINVHTGGPCVQYMYMLKVKSKRKSESPGNVDI